MMPRFLVVAFRVLTQLRRDRRTLAVIIIQPILIMGVFGYAFGGDVSDARVAIANMDRGTLGSKVLDRLNLTTVTPVYFDTGAEAEEAMRSGSVTSAVVFPANFTRNFDSAATAEPKTLILQIYQDNTNPQITSAILGAFNDALRDALENETGRAPGFAIEEIVVFGQQDARVLEFFVPGIAAFAIFQMGSMLTVVTIVKERSLGTLARVLASPIKRWEVVFGYTGAFALLSLVQAASIIAVSTLIFRVPVHGSVVLAVLATTLVGIVALGFGILVSGVARTEFQAVQSIFLFTFPMLFLSGVFAPAETIPTFIRPLMKVIPLSYAVDALRDILNHGRGFAEVAPDLAVLAGFAFAFLAAATFSFGRRV